MEEEEEEKGFYTLKPWGGFHTFYEFGSDYYRPHIKIKELFISPKERISLQSHDNREEHWIIIQGKALVINGNENSILIKNDSVFIKRGTVHRVQNVGDDTLYIIEVQIGDMVSEDDIIRYKDDYGRSDLKPGEMI